MEWTKEEKVFRNSIAATFANLAIGFGAVSTIGYLNSANSDISLCIYFLLGLGVFSALLSLYLAYCPRNWGKKPLLEFLETETNKKSVESLTWLLVVLGFGWGLWQIKVSWLKYAGLLTVLCAFMFYFRNIIQIFFKIHKDSRKIKE